MLALLSLVVCLSGQPSVCETVAPAVASDATGRPPTLAECLGVAGQVIARGWLSGHPGYVLKRVQCSVSNNPARLRDQIEGPRA